MLIDMASGQAAGVSYCTRLKPKSTLGSSWLSAETAAPIRQYDPRSEMMCILLNPRKASRAYALPLDYQICISLSLGRYDGQTPVYKATAPRAQGTGVCPQAIMREY